MCGLVRFNFSNLCFPLSLLSGMSYSSVILTNISFVCVFIVGRRIIATRGYDQKSRDLGVLRK